MTINHYPLLDRHHQPLPNRFLDLYRFLAGELGNDPSDAHGNSSGHLRSAAKRWSRVVGAARWSIGTRLWLALVIIGSPGWLVAKHQLMVRNDHQQTVRLFLWGLIQPSKRQECAFFPAAFHLLVWPTWISTYVGGVLLGSSMCIWKKPMEAIHMLSLFELNGAICVSTDQLHLAYDCFSTTIVGHCASHNVRPTESSTDPPIHCIHELHHLLGPFLSVLCVIYRVQWL